MRKLISILIAVVFLLSASACGNNNSSDKKKPTSGSNDNSSDIFGTINSAITVPNFVGMTVQEIKEKYGDKFNLKIEYERSADVPAGTVISQDKSKGRVIRKTQEIVITISSGAELVEIPRIANLSKTDAQLQLTRLGFNCEFVSKHDDTVTEGHVISTNPQEGEFVKYGTSIQVYISVGPETKYVDNVNCIGYDVEYAKQKIKKAGLTVGTITYEDGGKQKGVVLRQSPDTTSNYSVPMGSKIDLVVSTGKTNITTTKEIQLPSFLGRDYSDVIADRDYADILKFKVVSNQYSDEYASGQIISQSPKAGEVVATGTIVEVIVSLGPSIVTMPNVIGFSREDALLHLLKVGFSYNNIFFEEKHVATEAPGAVILTDPEPGIRIHKNEKITVILNSYIG